MLNREQYLDFHTEYYNSLENSTNPENSYLPYDIHNIQANTATGPQWLIFHQLAENFIRELLNANNQFLTNIRKLEIWIEILNECHEEIKNDLIFEIISPLGSYVIGTPYIVKQRYIYSAVMITHQTRMLQDPTINDGSLKERKIGINTVKGYRDSFSSMPQFTDILVQIDNDDFVNVTSNYRNLNQHRIPPRIEVGLGMTFNRFRASDGSVSYGLGGTQALRLTDIIPTLYNQHQFCNDTFYAIWSFINEQVLVWKEIRPNNT
ncbi:MAG: hypothetical protein IEMM0007_1297 [bacterium]|nr:MAG: hypothetical protein IEMM0007_1297 [bacterium]